MALANEPDYALAGTGLQVHDIELARIDDFIDVKSYLPALETAAGLGARHVISSIWTSRRSRAMDSLGELCDLVMTVGSTVNLEFVSGSSVTTLEEAVSVCRAVNRRNCGIPVDALHFDRSRAALEQLDRVQAGWLHFAHVCDAPREIPATIDGMIQTGREARLDPGEGGIDIAAILDRLPEMPYSLEIPNLDRAKALGYPEHVRLCLRNARKYLCARMHV